METNLIFEFDKDETVCVKTEAGGFMFTSSRRTPKEIEKIKKTYIGVMPPEGCEPRKIKNNWYWVNNEN